MLPPPETVLLCIQVVAHLVFHQVCPLVGARLRSLQNAGDMGKVILSCLYHYMSCFSLLKSLLVFLNCGVPDWIQATIFQRIAFKPSYSSVVYYL